MKILVMSDSHGRTKNVHEVIKNEENIDMIIHLGDEYRDFEEINDSYDIEAHGVVGNIDYFYEGPSYKIIEVLNKKIFISHGHKYRVKSTLDIFREEAIERNVDIALFGHSHVPYIEDEEIFILNPGSISQPRSEKYPSYAVLEITEDKIIGNIIHIK